MDVEMEEADAEEMRRAAVRESFGANGIMDESEEEGSEACFSTYPSGAITPMVDEAAGGQGGGAGDKPWEFVAFSSSRWKKVAEDLLMFSGKGGGEQWKLDQAGFDVLRGSKAQFAERFTVIRGKLKFNLKLGERAKTTDPSYGMSLPCDDAESQSDNFVSVFDGVGQGGVW